MDRFNSTGTLIAALCIALLVVLRPAEVHANGLRVLDERSDISFAYDDDDDDDDGGDDDDDGGDDDDDGGDDDDDGGDDDDDGGSGGGSSALGGSGGLSVEYFDNSGVSGGGVKQLSHVDWNTPEYTGSLANLDFSNGHNAFQSGAPTNKFAIEANGTITIPSTGLYTFEIEANDGAELWIDGSSVAEKDGRGTGTDSGSISLSAGDYTFRVRYFDHNGSHTLHVRWTRPGDSGATAIPASAFTGGDGSGGDGGSEPEVPDLGGSGQLDVVYFDTSGSSVRSVDHINWDATPSFTSKWNDVNRGKTRSAWESGGPTDRYAVQIDSTISIPATGIWTFQTRSDDGSKLYINGARVVANDGNHSMRTRSGSVTLTQGDHDFRIRYFENWGRQGLIANWSGPGVSTQVIPASVFSSSGGGGDSVATTGPADPGDLTADWLTSTGGGSDVNDLSFASPDSTSTVDWVAWPSSNTEMVTDGPTDGFGVRLRGMLVVPVSGSYTFTLGSAQSAVLVIDGKTVVDDSESHTWREKTGTIELSAGPVRFETRMLDSSGSHGLSVSWQGPSDSSPELIPASAYDPWEPIRITSWSETSYDHAMMVRLKRRAVRDGLLDPRSSAYQDVDTMDKAMELFDESTLKTVMGEAKPRPRDDR